MKSKAIALALLACFFGAQAEVVSSQQAAVAAGTWARLGKGAALGVRLGERVLSSQEVVVEDGCTFHAVRLESGTVFLSGDTDFEPVVAFTTNPNVTLEKGTPLYDLLCGDARARVGDRKRRRSARRPLGVAAGASSSPDGRANGLWAQLLGNASRANLKGGSSAPPLVSLRSEDELYVSQMLKTQWSQTDVSGKPCYNYYTPNQYPCGCGATAMAQIMRYHEFPTDPIDTETEFDITVNKAASKVKMIGGDSGVFDWDAMVDMPSKVAMDDSQCEAIGKLTYNAGLALHMDYAAKGSSCSPENTWLAFKTFGYQGGYIFWDGTSYSTGQGGLHTAMTRHNALLTSLDAGCPVFMLIYGYEKVNGELVKDDSLWAAHAVVGDGYGFRTIEGVSTEYMHVNLGWGGTDDAWYNIPEIDCSSASSTIGGSATDFLYLGGAACCVSPTELKEIVSGRISDEDGIGLESGVLVSALNPETGEVLATATPGPHGVFVFQFEHDTKCKIQAETTEGRKLVAMLDETVSVGRTMPDDSGIVKTGSSVGSRWLGNIVMKSPTVSVVDGTSGETVAETSTMEQALEIARNVPSPTLNITYETRLRTPVAIDFACVIAATNDDPYASRIVCADGAALTVAAGGDVSLSNVVFAKSSATPVCVQTDGLVRLGGTVDFNVAEGVVALDLASPSGLKVVAPLTCGFALACEGAMALGDVFGSSEGLDADAAAASARLIANAGFASGEVRGGVSEAGGTFDLVWAEMAVPVEAATGYFVGADGTTNTAARIDDLFEKYAESQDLPAGTPVVIRKSGALNGRYALSRDVTVVGEADPSGDLPTLTAAKDAGFAFEGCEFAVENILFVGHTGKPVLEVGGASGQVSGCRFADILGDTGVSGALSINAGGAVTVSGCVFENCRAKKTQLNCNGGAITLRDAGSALELFDTSMTGCSASLNGGGLYAGKGTSVTLGGLVVARDNVQGGDAPGNIYLASTDVSLAVAEKLTGGTGAVGLRIYKGNLAGYEFATISGDLDAMDVATTAQSFVCDADAGLEAWDVDEAGEAFAWRAHVEDRTVDISLAVAETCREGESSVRYYATLSDAFADLAETGGTLTLLSDCDFVDDVTLAHDVTIVSRGETFTITRANESALVVSDGAKLTLEDVVLGGGVASVAAVSRAFICIDGGTLDLQDGAELNGIYGNGSRASGAVTVYNGGAFVMNDGARIVNCGNDWRSASDATGYGAVTIEAGTADLLGGEISDCQAYAYGCGLFAGNGSTVRISGAVTLDGSANASGCKCNLTVADRSSLELVGELDGVIGVTRAASAPTNVFGKVTADLAFAALTNSAACFVNDETGARGMAVTNAAADVTLLVWSDAIAADGSVKLTIDGEEATYWCVGEVPRTTPKATPMPIAFFALTTPVSPDEYVISVTTAVARCWYSLYETDTLDGGFPTEGVEPVDRKQATEDGTITFTRPKVGEALFWKVVAAPEE